MDKINVLHISNDFPNSSVYKQLAIHLDELNVCQTIYAAVRTQSETKFNSPELKHLDIYVHNLLRYHDKIFFRYKIQKVYKDLQKSINFSDINFIHSHTLYSDGAVALKIKKDFGIPYITTVRNTALNAFDKLRPDLKWRRNEILSEAEKIVFLSPAYRKKMLSRLNRKMQRKIEQKLISIPNGIDPVFFNTEKPKKEDQATIRVLYVGRFLKLKNIKYLIKAVEKLNKSLDITLTLVGGGGDDLDRVKKMINPRSFVTDLGVIKDIDKLRQIYHSHDLFVMTSKPETFGLVYIEALSQGLPVIYTEGEGIDGYFHKGSIAEAVEDPQDSDEIAKKIRILADRLDEDLRKKCIAEARKFNWNQIAREYRSIYKS